MHTKDRDGCAAGLVNGRDTLSIRSSRPLETFKGLEEARDAFIRAPELSASEFGMMRKAYKENGMRTEAALTGVLEEQVLGRTLNMGPVDVLVGTVYFINAGLDCGSGEIGPFADVAKLATARVRHGADEYKNDDSFIMKRMGAMLVEINEPIETLVDAWVGRRKWLGNGAQKRAPTGIRRENATVERAESDFTLSGTLKEADFKILENVYATNGMPLESIFITELSNLAAGRTGMGLYKLFDGVCDLAAKSTELQGREAAAAGRIMELAAVRMASGAKEIRELAPDETLATMRQGVLFERLGLLVLNLASFW